VALSKRTTVGHLEMNRSNCIRSLAIRVPGVFAAGDVRAGAMNRVASAVGEGSMVVPFAHEYLALT